MSMPLHSNTRQRDIWLPIGTTLAIVAVMILTLRLMGRLWHCEQNDWAIYIHQAWQSNHTSQHLADPYTWTHLLHGVVLYCAAIAILTLIRLRMTTLLLLWSFTAAIALEAGWEVLENTPWVINRYRQNTASLDYFGDSIINSIGDTLACALGFCIAAKIGLRWSIALFVVVELALLWWIRDNLTMAVVMLLWPVESFKAWQMVLQQ